MSDPLLQHISPTPYMVHGAGPGLHENAFWWFSVSTIQFYILLVFAFIGFNSTALTLYKIFSHFVRNHNQRAAPVCHSIGTQTPPPTPRQLWKEYQKVWNRRYYRLFF